MKGSMRKKRPNPKGQPLQKKKKKKKKPGLDSTQRQ